VTKHWPYRAAALAAAALAVATACGGDDLVYPTETRPLTPGGEVIPPQTSVTLRLPETARARFAGYYAAAEEGFFEERKLDIEFTPGHPEEAVSSGRAEFGIGALRDLLAARDRGIDLVNVAQVQRQGGDGIFVDADWIAKPANQDIAVRFLEASFEGWAFCRDDPDACLRIVLDRRRKLDDDVQRSELHEANALIWPNEHGIGLIEPAEFRRTATRARQAGAIDEPASAEAYRDDLAILALTQLGHHGIDLTGAGWEPTPTGE
jgi:ABC-type nitrate/sulfonate/bicarbonate transport system substrate-binding protein